MRAVRESRGHCEEHKHLGHINLPPDEKPDILYLTRVLFMTFTKT
jgi:hypothetical protein